MKDLITTIASIMILMVFVMLFCANHLVISKVLMADALVDKLENDISALDDEKKKEKYIVAFAKCFNCTANEVLLTEDKEGVLIQMPLKNIIACGEFLGITEEENQSIFKRRIFRK